MGSFFILFIKQNGMERVEWYITEDRDDISVQNMMFTYSEEEKEQHCIDSNNAWLVLSPKFIPLYPELLDLGYSLLEAVLLGFIDFFLQSNQRFYCTNVQLAKLFRCSEPTISTAIKNLEKKGDIALHKRIKGWWWTIRFITLENQKFWFGGVKKVDWIYNKIIYNKNNISNSNELDNISYPTEKRFISIKQKTNRSVVEENPLPGPLPVVAGEFTKDSIERFPSIQYQMSKNGNKYLRGLIKDYNKLIEEYGEETVETVLRYIKQDEFWSKQIQSISKLRKKNRDWVPYMVVMMEKIQNWKLSNNVITL